MSDDDYIYDEAGVFQKCPDCKGSKIYIGFNLPPTLCETCDGLGMVLVDTGDTWPLWPKVLDDDDFIP